MKKILLTLVFVFALVSISSANNVTNNNSINTELRVLSCWDIANDIEAGVCGYVGCNFLLWEAIFVDCKGI